MPSKILLAVVIGTVLEYFDFFLFAHFSLIIAPHFFTDLDPIIASIEGLSLLSVGFIMRPLGAIFFGKIGDSKGRKPALAFAILWTSIPTFIISCLPTYHTIGIFAPIILILCRMGQGFFVGGEYTNAGIFLMEHASLEKRGFYSSILCISASLGSLIALACAFVILNCDSPSWAWRVPFFLASVCGFIGYKLRTILIESPEISNFQKNISTNTQKPTWQIMAENKKAFFVIVASGALVGTLISTPVTYTNFYLTKIREWSGGDAVYMTLFFLVIYIGILPFVGKLCDRIGKTQPIMLGATVAATLLSYPLFFCLTHGYVIITQIGFALFASFYEASIHKAMIELYPTYVRCRAISLGYTLGMSVGGASPMTEAWLTDITNNHLAPAMYVSVISIIGVIAMCLYPSARRQSQGSKFKDYKFIEVTD